MSNRLFITLLAVIVCTLIVLGVVNLRTDTSVDFYKYGLGKDVKDFTGTFQQSIGFFTKFGDMGRDILLRLGITETRNHTLDIITYRNDNNENAYILIWVGEVQYGDINFNGPIPTMKYFYYRIYAYQDYENSNTLKQLIENSNAMYYLPTENEQLQRHDGWKDLQVQAQLFTTTQYYDLNEFGTYHYVSRQSFDMSTYGLYSFTEVN